MSTFYDDIAVGLAVDFGSFAFTREDVVAFAGKFDPQPFHLDEAAAECGPFGRLAASGWHTAAVWMKLNVAYWDARRAAAQASGEAVAAPGPSPGFKNLRWISPVFVGDTIRFGATITGKRPVSRPGWGILMHTGTGHRETGELVFSFEASALWQRRPDIEGSQSAEAADAARLSGTPKASPDTR